MPSIELLSVGCESKILFSGRYRTFAVMSELGRPKSHRGIFQPVLDEKKGLMVHLGNPSLDPEEDSLWWADELLDWPRVDAVAPLGSEKEKPCIFKYAGAA